jgi:hypothetical protein
LLPARPGHEIHHQPQDLDPWKLGTRADVGSCVTNDVLKENLEHSTGLLIDQARDTFDATTTN